MVSFLTFRMKVDNSCAGRQGTVRLQLSECGELVEAGGAHKFNSDA